MDHQQFQHRQYEPQNSGHPMEPHYVDESFGGPPAASILNPEPMELSRAEAPRRLHKKSKRERKPRREPNCSFCLGNDDRNKEGTPEQMLSCFKCGRSGHPSCLEIAYISSTVSSYSWECIECKKCEICKEKGDDVSSSA